MSSAPKHLNYNVIYPKDIFYYPMLEFGSVDKKPITEIDVIKQVVDADIKYNKHVTVINTQGPPGVGKTTLGMYMAMEYECPMQIINCSGDMQTFDLLGSHLLINGETIWMDGPLPAIIRATNDHAKTNKRNVHGVLLINEINVPEQKFQLVFNPIFDKQEGVVLTLNNNEIVTIDPNAHLLVICTMNPDVLAVNELHEAVNSRIGPTIVFPYPNPDKEAKLVNFLIGTNIDVAKKFINVINECRDAKIKNSQISSAPMTRSLIDWIIYSETLGITLAYELIIVNKFGTNEKEKRLLRSLAVGKEIMSILLPNKASDLIKNRPVSNIEDKVIDTKKKSKLIPGDNFWEEN